MAIEIGSRAGRLGSLLGQGAAQGIQSHLNDIAQERLLQLKGMPKQQAEANRITNQTNALQSLAQKSNIQLPSEIIESLGKLPEKAFGDAYVNLLGNASFPGGQQAQTMMGQLSGQEQVPQEPMSTVEEGSQYPNPFEPQEARRHRESMGFKEKQFTYNQIKPFLDQIEGDRKELRESTPIIKEMESLEESGKLNSPAFLKTLKLLGVDDVSALLQPESQAFQKLETFFLRNLKNVFGARPTQFDVQQYIKGIPTLMNSPEGRKMIYHDLKNMMKMKQIVVDAADTYKKRYKNNPDKLLDISQEVDAITKPKIDKIFAKTSFGKEGESQGPQFAKPGSKIRNPVTGEIKVATGKERIR